MFKRLAFVITASLVFAGCTIPSLPSGKKAGLQVSSTPAATVFLNGDSLGSTPIQKQENLKPGPATIRIVPQDANMLPYEVQVTLTPGVLTIVDHRFSATPDMSSGHSLSFEPISNKKINQLAIATLPGSINVTVDGNPQGFTPTLLDTVDEGDHRIMLTSPGYEDKLILARTINGYKLVINAQLAKKPEIAPTPEATPSASLTPTPSTPTSTKKITPTPTKVATSSAVTTPKPYVLVDSSAGFVNVRATPSTSGTLLGKANNGESFPYLSTSSAGDWIELTYSGQSGWVSAPYVTVVK